MGLATPEDKNMKYAIYPLSKTQLQMSLVALAAPIAMAYDARWYFGACAGTTQATIDDE